MTSRTFFKTIIQVEVLSEEPLEWDGLLDVHQAITSGGCSGVVREVASVRLTGAEVAEALNEQGSEPAFFQLTEKGEEDDECCVPTLEVGPQSGAAHE